MTKIMKMFLFILGTTTLMIYVLSPFAECTPIASTRTETKTTARLTASQAIQFANVFCRKIGQPVTETGTATFAADDQHPNGDYWQPVWNVVFPGQAEVEVVDATGIIANYNKKVRSKHTHQLRPDDSSPDNTVLQQEAVQLAKNALVASGQMESLQFNGAELFSFNPKITNSYTWFVTWYRTKQGIFYYDQHVSIDIDAYTGEIDGLILMFSTPPLDSAIMAVSQDNAIYAAASQIINQGVEQEATHKETHLEIISPNYHWNTHHGLSENTPRLAWATTFIVDGHWHQVKIDTETGDILDEDKDNGPAGQQMASSIKTLPAPPISQMLKTAQAVYLRDMDAKGTWTAKPFLKFNAKTQPHAIAMLTKIADFRHLGPAEVPSQQIVLVNRSHAIGVYSYSPKTGLLGNGSDWAVVPSEFPKWLQRTAAAATASPAKAATK